MLRRAGVRAHRPRRTRRVVDEPDLLAIVARCVGGPGFELRRARDIRDSAVADDDRRAIAPVFERDADAVERIRTCPRLRRYRKSPGGERNARANLARLATGNDDGRARPADGERQVGRPELALAERILEPEFVQIGSSHRTMTAVGATPGGSTTSRRTSRNPVRVPTTG